MCKSIKNWKSKAIKKPLISFNLHIRKWKQFHNVPQWNMPLQTTSLLPLIVSIPFIYIYIFIFFVILCHRSRDLSIPKNSLKSEMVVPSVGISTKSWYIRIYASVQVNIMLHEILRINSRDTLATKFCHTCRQTFSKK